MCSLILTWNNSSQPILSLMSTFFYAQKHVCFLNQLIQLEKTLLNCGDEWIYNAVTVTQSWRCFGIGTPWKKTENWYFHLMLRQRKSIFSDQSMTPPSDCTICQMSYDRSVLRGGEFSYGCHTTFLSELGRSWSLQNLGMLWCAIC